MKSLNHIKHPINRLALHLAAFSACFGIVQVLSYLVFESEFSINLGIVHLIPTFIFHLIIFLVVCINAFLNRKDLPEYFMTLFLMLLNIPLAMTCFWIVVQNV